MVSEESNSERVGTEGVARRSLVVQRVDREVSLRGLQEPKEG